MKRQNKAKKDSKESPTVENKTTAVVHQGENPVTIAHGAAVNPEATAFDADFDAMYDAWGELFGEVLDTAQAVADKAHSDVYKTVFYGTIAATKAVLIARREKAQVAA